MLLGLISDTHNQIDRTRRAMDLLIDAGSETIIHCGDFTRPEMLAVCAVRPLYFVLGNNDAAAAAELQRAAQTLDASCLGGGGAVVLAGKRIAITHGHLAGEMRRLLDAGPDYLCCGHSHIAGEQRMGGVRRVNPGALHRAREFTVALLNLETAAVRFLPVTR